MATCSAGGRFAICTAVICAIGMLSGTRVAAAQRTGCGYTPTAARPCGAQCPVTDPSTGTCVDSCGHECASDADCGAYPASPCRACVSGRCSGDAAFGHCAQQQPWAPGTPQAPVLPSAWNATFIMTNYTKYGPAEPPQPGRTWYDASVGGLRQDFDAPCPFRELQPPYGNNGSCSVVFYEGDNLYCYNGLAGVPGAGGAAGAAGVCCSYRFPNWRPDAYRLGNASWGGTDTLPSGKRADHWRFTYTCPWIRPQPQGPWPARLPARTVQRDIWTAVGGNTPLRMNETLTSGVVR